MPLINIKLAKPMPDDAKLAQIAEKITQMMVDELGKKKERIVINFEAIEPAHITFGGVSVAQMSANAAPKLQPKWRKSGSAGLVKIGIITSSDRAHSGEYEDISGPAAWECLSALIGNELEGYYQLVPDERAAISAAIRQLSAECDLVITTGGTGPAARDITPEATRDVCDRELDGFAELMRACSLKYVPTAILSRQIAAVCGDALVINLPGKPKAIAECLEPIWPAIPYAMDLIGAAYVHAASDAPAVFRPSK